MRISVLLALLTLAFGAPSSAQGQTFPKMEVFGGYSYASTDLLETPEVVPGGRDGAPFGWNASATYYLADNLGLTAEAGGHYMTQTLSSSLGDAKLKYHTFLFGPTLLHKDGKVEMYTHMLVGIGHATIENRIFGGTNPDTDFTMAVGGGVNYTPGRIGIRIMQIDYVVGQLYQSINDTIRVTGGAFVRW